MVHEHHIRALADSFHVAERTRLSRDRAAVHAYPDAVRAAALLCRPVEMVPDLDAPVVVPLDPLAVNRIVPVALLGERLARLLAELPRAVVAIADALASQARPTVVRETLGMAALDDLG